MSSAVTFVDDWQLIACDPSRLASLMRILESFADILDLALDLKKTYVWSVSASGRECLHDAGFQAAQNGRNLGAHVQYSRQHANKVLADRMTSLTEWWGRLRRSHARDASKVAASRVAAWPRAMHAIAATKVGENWLQTLRSGAMKGLGMDAAGANSFLHLGAVEQVDTEPGFWSIFHTLRLVRDCGHPEVVKSHVQHIAYWNPLFPGNGITTTLVDRLAKVGWHVDDQSRIVDDFGTFSLLAVCVTELKFRLQWAWHKVIAASVAHRPGLQDWTCG